jgi:stage III sporulation protein AF
MIDFLSSWAKTLSLSVIIVSILEMLLPNNKTKKYIRMVMGIYILFNIVSPFMKSVQASSVENFSFENYTNNITVQTKNNQSSMDKRLEQLYIEQLEKDIKTKITNKGYDVIKCDVNAVITGDEKNAGIKKVVLKIKKNEANLVEDKKEVEEKLIDEVQKIKKVNISNQNKNNSNEITDADINNLKKFLKEEYGVEDKCLKIN